MYSVYSGRVEKMQRITRNFWLRERTVLTICGTVRGVGGIDSWGSGGRRLPHRCGKGHCVRVYDRVGDLLPGKKTMEQMTWNFNLFHRLFPFCRNAWKFTGGVIQYK